MFKCFISGRSPCLWDAGSISISITVWICIRIFHFSLYALNEHLNSIWFQWCLVLQKLLKRETLLPHVRSSSSGPWRLFLGPLRFIMKEFNAKWLSDFCTLRGIYIYRYTMNCKCLLTWILCTLSKRTIFIYIHVLVGFYMKTTHCFVNIFHVSYEIFCVVFSPCRLADPFSQRMSGRKYQRRTLPCSCTVSHVMNVNVAVTRSAYELSCCLCLQ